MRMNLVKFIENRYQELSLEIQKNPDAFEVHKDAEIKAAHGVLSFYRQVLKWVMIPKVLWNYFQVRMGLRSPPEPVVVNKMKAEAEAKRVADQLLREASHPDYTPSKISEIRPPNT